MNIDGKRVLIFPEYHLTDLPPQISITTEEACEVLSGYREFGFDVLVSGYVEKDGYVNYSSVLVIDGDNTHNVRKNRVHGTEQGIITPSKAQRTLINLSIGATLVVICNECKFIDDNGYRNIEQNEAIVNLLLVSAMFHNFEENKGRCLNYCRDRGIRRLITADRFYGLDITELD